ncbi:hypothetical protein LCL95_01020 [Bacillus timonensis]|nr:hypothetical protein [Bacillus timonensis]
MRGFVLLMMMVATFITGCNFGENEVESSFSVHDFIVSIGGNEDFSEQVISYNLTITYPEGAAIVKDSIEPIVTQWVEERKIEVKLVSAQSVSEENAMTIEGKITIDTEGMTKKEIVESQNGEIDVIGLIFETENGDRYRLALDGEYEVTQLKEG